MAKIEATLAAMRDAPQTVRFAALKAVCEHYFGPPRQRGTSHCVFKMPWPGDPRVNIQSGKGGSVKVYQVRQVLAAIDRLAATHTEGKKE
jgi:hypothetical protein